MSFKLTTPKALTILATLISCLQTSADSTAKDVCLNFTTGEKIYFSFDSHPVLTIIDSEIKISSAKNEIFIYSMENLHKITFENDSGISDYPLPGDDNGTISREDSEFIAFNIQARHHGRYRVGKRCQYVQRPHFRRQYVQNQSSKFQSGHLYNQGRLKKLQNDHSQKIASNRPANDKTRAAGQLILC